MLVESEGRSLDQTQGSPGHGCSIGADSYIFVRLTRTMLNLASGRTCDRYCIALRLQMRACTTGGGRNVAENVGVG
jgi:hypothetical protein